MGKKRVLVCYGVDIDAVAGWLGSYGGEDSTSDISRGLFPAHEHVLSKAATYNAQVSGPEPKAHAAFSNSLTNTRSSRRGSFPGTPSIHSQRIARLCAMQDTKSDYTVTPTRTRRI